jgi:hypothetical protein
VSFMLPASGHLAFERSVKLGTRYWTWTSRLRTKTIRAMGTAALFLNAGCPYSMRAERRQVADRPTRFCWCDVEVPDINKLPAKARTAKC